MEHWSYLQTRINIQIHRGDDGECLDGVLIELPGTVQCHLNRVTDMAEFPLERRWQRRWQGTSEWIRVLTCWQFDLIAVLSSQQIVVDIEVLLMTGQIFGFFGIFAIGTRHFTRFTPSRIRLTGKPNFDSWKRKVDVTKSWTQFGGFAFFQRDRFEWPWSSICETLSAVKCAWLNPCGKDYCHSIILSSRRTKIVILFLSCFSVFFAHKVFGVENCH